MSFTLSSIYVCSCVYYAYFLNDYYSSKNDCQDKAEYLWCAMVALNISAFSHFLIAIAQFVFQVILMLSGCTKML